MDPETYQLLQTTPSHIKMHNLVRTLRVPDLSLGAMPLICGDSFEEYDTPDVPLDVELERHLADYIYSAPLVGMSMTNHRTSLTTLTHMYLTLAGTSAFPTLQYLCRLWPVRSAERTSLRPPYSKADLGENVLVMFHPKDTWNYFAMSDSAVGAVWPGARVMSDLAYGVSALLDAYFTANNLLMSWNRESYSTSIIVVLT